MVTTVGTENDLKALVKSFIQLEHDAIAAYETCIEKLESPDRKEKVREFLGDHERHLRELEDLARDVGAYDPGSGDMKGVLTSGKVKLAGMTGGDGAVLKAMSSNETDTVTAYGRASESSVVEPAHQEVFRRAQEDERRHKEWIEAEAEAA